jgi:hypothetical protein
MKGSIKTLLRHYQGSIKALEGNFEALLKGCIKPLLSLY